jgi:taurine dioxygenase
VTLKISQLSPILGAEVTGVDLATGLTEAAFKALYQAWLDHNGILVIRDQDLTHEQHISFSGRIGELDHHVVTQFVPDGYPELYRVSNKEDEDGKYLGNPQAGNHWHTDNSYLNPPAKASLLYAVEIPPVGGDTMFTSMYRAYEALSPALKRTLDGLSAEHLFERALSNFSTFKATDGQIDGTPPVRHPVVNTHPETGQKSLYVNPGFTTRIIGLNADESDFLLQFLFQHATQPQFIYRHRWRAHDLVLWDNRCTMHYAVQDFYGRGVRDLYRTTVKGDALAA